MVKLNSEPSFPKSTASSSKEVHDWQKVAGPKTETPHSRHRKPMRVPSVPASLVILNRLGSTDSGMMVQVNLESMQCQLPPRRPALSSSLLYSKRFFPSRNYGYDSE